MIHPELSVVRHSVDTMASGTTELTEHEHDILAFERVHWRTFDGRKEDLIRQEFGFGATRYFQELNALIDKPAALAAHPVLIRRLRRLRSTRAAAQGRREPHAAARD